MRYGSEAWSEADKKVADMDTPSWEDSETSIDEEDVSELKELLNSNISDAGEDTGETDTNEDNDTAKPYNQEDNFIGCPDSDTFDPDI